MLKARHYLFGIILLAAGFVVQYKTGGTLLSDENFDFIKVGMSSEVIKERLGEPLKKHQSSWHYKFSNSKLVIFFNAKKLDNAVLKFHHPKDISEINFMVNKDIVKVGEERTIASSPNWFYAGHPEEGKLLKVLKDGKVESLSWVKPFKAPNEKKSDLSFLVKEFQSK